jgi:hypothetical protein
MGSSDHLQSRMADRDKGETSENLLICRQFASGANRDRTGDLLLAKQALSQLSYGPEALRV